MKKLLATFGAILLGLSLTSCGKKIDSSNWISSLEDAKTAARAENKKIFLYFSALDADNISEKLSEDVFDTTEFKTKMTESYVLCHVDFSNSRFEVLSPDPEKEDPNPKETRKLQDVLNKDMRIANIYSVSSLPAFMVLTKHGYVVDKIEFEATADMDDILREISTADKRAEEIEDLLKTINTGKKDEVIKAIDNLYEMTYPDYRLLLKDFNEKLLKMDKKNESKLAVKHLFALSDSNAQYAILDDDIEKALKELEMPAKYDFLEPEDRQQVYYSVGYFMLRTGSDDYTKIKNYFQKAYDMAPESDYAKEIKYAVSYIEEMAAEAQSPAEGPAAAPEAAGTVSDVPADNTEVKPAN